MAIDPKNPLTVGSLSSIEELRNWDSDNTPDCDVVEIRLDGIAADDLEEAFRLCLRYRSWSVPLLITARVKDEGGITDLDTAERCRRLEQFAEVATYADLEIASYPAMEATAKQLQAEGVILVLSYHNFDHTPANLDEQLALAIQYGADIPKFAVMHQTPADLQICSDFIQNAPQPISLMGMGALAPVSRVLYAQLGSVLNYGFLGTTPTAPGQWSAKQLKQAIATTDSLSK